MWYVARKRRLITLSLLPSLALATSGCSLRILGIDQNALDEVTADEINTFSVLGAKGGTDTTADSRLNDGGALTAEWVDTTGEDSYEVSVLDSGGYSTLCGPVSVASDTTSYTFTGCALTPGENYRIQVIAKSSSSGSSRSAQSTFQVGPFISIGNLSTDEWGVASIPVTLSYAASSPVTVQYVTVDGSAQAGSDYTHLPLSTLTIPAGQSSAMISVPLFKDFSNESSETFRIALSSPSGAALESSEAEVQVIDTDPAPLTGFTQVTSGNYHTCGLTSAGAVLCWGYNGSGNLGDNDSVDRAIPGAVLGLSSGVVQTSAGSHHTCALTSAGAVKCWGSNSIGQLGDNSTVNKPVPTDVLGLSSGVIQISAGGNQSCALTSAGAALCWGSNNMGRLGDGTTTNRLVPTAVSGLSSGVAQIAMGDASACALTTAGAVKCWGWNPYGNLGDNTNTSRSVPTDVVGLSSGVTQISVGLYVSCALLSSGAAKCWGNNGSGSLGDNTTTSRWVPTDVFGLASGIAQISTGRNLHACAVTSTGVLKCWGQNDYSQLGDQTQTNRTAPIDVTGIPSSVVQVAEGYRHTCAVTSSGSIYCWGYNAYGQLGENRQGDTKRFPTDVVSLSSGVTRIAAGSDFTCALTSSGSVKCWGYNGFGSIGDNSTLTKYTPTDVSGLAGGVNLISAGDYHSCALLTSGGVKCWGYNSVGQLGDNSTTDRLVPTDVSGLSSGVIQLATGSNHTCALLTDGSVKCWGYNFSGQLGINSTTNSLLPAAVTGLSSGVVQISAAGFHTCALLSGGSVKCWGKNSQGQLGDNTLIDRLVPTDVTGLSSGITQIVAGFEHSCALSSTGAVKCWGQNSQGALGDNTTVMKQIPTDVFGLASGVTQLTAGYGFTCALSSQGEVKCWGMNSEGTLGDGSSTSRLVPTEVLGLASGVTRIQAGASHACALIAPNGGVKCWGSDTSGQLGSAYTNLIPQAVTAE